MKNGITELVFILDRSGSMAGLEDDTIGGFNAMIEKQKKLDGKVYVSTVLFANDSKVLHDRINIEKIEPLTERDYCVGGGTALIDAIGGAIHHIGNVHTHATVGITHLCGERCSGYSIAQGVRGQRGGELLDHVVVGSAWHYIVVYK